MQIVISIRFTIDSKVVPSQTIIMWKKIAFFTLQNRKSVLAILLISTAIMGIFASKVQLSYDSTGAIPSNHPQLKTFTAFKQKFGEDGNLIVVGFDGASFTNKENFSKYQNVCSQLQKLVGVQSVLAVPLAVTIFKQKNDTSESLASKPIFSSALDSLESQWQQFYNLPFYNNLLHYPESGAHIIAIRLQKEVLFTAQRIQVVNEIEKAIQNFSAATKVKAHISGLPYIRSKMAMDIKNEMSLFLLASLLLTALLLFLFFRNGSAILISLATVIIGVIWSLGILFLLGFKISLLTALVPPLIVVIGIPNCIYFFNKYHQEIAIHGQKAKAIVLMVHKMGVITLFTNLTAAIGFGVFCFTKSKLLQEFGWVAWLGILCVFLISLVLIPIALSFAKTPNTKHTNYLDNGFFQKVLSVLENAILYKRKLLYILWGLLLLLGIIGVTRLRTLAFMVDDLPKSNSYFTDLQYFEKNMHGVMPLEIWIDTKKKNGTTSLGFLTKLDELSTAVGAEPFLGKPISIIDPIKFARQAYYDGDSTSYGMPSGFDIAFLAPYLRGKNNSKPGAKNDLNTLLKSFVDSNKQSARVSVNMADIGSAKMPALVNKIKTISTDIFDTAKYTTTITGSSIIFLEGSKFIINSLQESIAYAFLMILVCMFFLFRDWRIVLMSIVSNIIPMLITAGIMGWFGIPLKPSTVLVFSISLGIAIDVTIRFLVAYKQELPKHNYDVKAAVIGTLHDTGISIIYTSCILMAGFLVFVASQFAGTKALGYLTCITLFLAMVINLTILPSFLLWMQKLQIKKSIQDPLWEVLTEEEDIELGQLKLD